MLSATQDCLALAHVQFETMHPFLDGNGRLSWLLIVLMLIEVGVLQQPVRRRLGRRACLCSGTGQISSHLPTRPWSAICGGACSRRINIQHRLVYQVLDDKRIVKVLRLWSHFEQFRPATGGMADQPRSGPAQETSALLMPNQPDCRGGRALRERNNRSGRPGKGRNPIDA